MTSLQHFPLLETPQIQDPRTHGTFKEPKINPAYDNLFVFGDSYCDVGNLFIATRGAVPAAPYFKGRFSNGPIWVDRLARLLNLPLTPSLSGGTNYAFGGAWVTAPQPLIGGAFIPSVPQQVEGYLRRHGWEADPNALYVLEGGGNDILGTTAGSPRQLAYGIASSIVDCAIRLCQAGAKHLLIPDLFDVGLLPGANRNADFASAASSATNGFLKSLLAIAQEEPGVRIVRMDVFARMNALQCDPGRFGFKAMARPCLMTDPCTDPEHTFFWDMHHPTEVGHECLASTLESALTKQ